MSQVIPPAYGMGITRDTFQVYDTQKDAQRNRIVRRLLLHPSLEGIPPRECCWIFCARLPVIHGGTRWETEDPGSLALPSFDTPCQKGIPPPGRLAKHLCHTASITYTINYI